jgi:hypothetical protein
VIIWQASPRQLNGLFLPSLQPFVLALPDAVAAEPWGGIDPYTRVGQLALTSRSLYVLGSGSTGELWRTPIPAAPPRPVELRAPTLTRQGRALTCTRGSWRYATSYTYSWVVDGRARTGAHRSHLAVTKDLKGHTVACRISAANTTGTTTRSSRPFHVR